MHFKQVLITQSFANVSGACAIIISLYDNLHFKAEILSAKVA